VAKFCFVFGRKFYTFLFVTFLSAYAHGMQSLHLHVNCTP